MGTLSDVHSTWLTSTYEMQVAHLGKRLYRSELSLKTSIRNFAFPGATAEYDLSAQLSRLFDLSAMKDPPIVQPVFQLEKATYSTFSVLLHTTVVSPHVSSHLYWHQRLWYRGLSRRAGTNR